MFTSVPFNISGAVRIIFRLFLLCFFVSSTNWFGVANAKDEIGLSPEVIKINGCVPFKDLFIPEDSQEAECICRPPLVEYDDGTCGPVPDQGFGGIIVDLCTALGLNCNDPLPLPPPLLCEIGIGPDGSNQTCAEAHERCVESTEAAVDQCRENFDKFVVIQCSKGRWPKNENPYRDWEYNSAAAGFCADELGLLCKTFAEIQEECRDEWKKEGTTGGGGSIAVGGTGLGLSTGGSFAGPMDVGYCDLKGRDIQDACMEKVREHQSCPAGCLDANPSTNKLKISTPATVYSPTVRLEHALFDNWVGEVMLNNLGYELLKRGKMVEAIEIFKLNVERYPQSANTYDSLAEAFLKLGDYSSAINNYRRALAKDPNMGSARAGLEVIQKRLHTQ